MSEAVEIVEGKSAIIRFDGRLCIHARRCVLAEPGVFKANAQGPWIDPDAASADALMRVAINCPSGAIRVERRDGGEQEGVPKVNTIALRENGPLAVHAETQLNGERIGMRATLCRCGQSNNKPYCDGSHVSAGFVATGETETTPSQPLAKRDGLLSIRTRQNGPLKVVGPVEIIAGTGRTIHRTEDAALCRCGRSARKPFCDGSHARFGFTAPGWTAKEA
jgi:CDGSH-type Zn-finger protein/uncharacterized Fe-S cluster protein YjdI